MPEVPRISRARLALFRGYARRYLRRHFHHLRVSTHESARGSIRGPIVVYLNHPSWWDPLVCLVLAADLFPERRNLGPIEQSALDRYRFFAKLGFFGVETGSRHGAVTFLTVGRSILQESDAALWVTAQGRFADVRERPVELRAGLGHLLARVDEVTVLPLALEYPFWTERLPEALARIGQPILVTRETQRGGAEWTSLLEERLLATQQDLAELSIARDPTEFRNVLHGRAGVGGIYDGWRALRAKLRGESFQREHMTDAEAG